jgi:hypothetical protein
MKFGAIYPHQEIGTDPVVIRDWAQTAEALSYSHIAAYDHVLGTDNWRRQAEQWSSLNADYVSMRAVGLKGVGPELNSPAEHIKSLETYWETVGDLQEVRK